MDILRNELNRIYEAQNLGDEELPSAQLHEVKMRASAMVEASNACTVITDASSDRCFVYAGAFGRLMGFADDEKTYKEVSSSDEDEIYERLHPEDLVEKRMLEYDFFKMADRMPTEQKMSVKAVCRVRMKDSRGIYRTVENSTQVAAPLPKGEEGGLEVIPINPNQLPLKAQDVDYGQTAEERVNCDYDGNPMTIGFNGVFMIQILGALHSDAVQLRLSDSARPGVYEPMPQEEGEDMLVIQMPMQVL